jgi:hypothetical protein
MSHRVSVCGYRRHPKICALGAMVFIQITLRYDLVLRGHQVLGAAHAGKSEVIH